MQRPAPSRDAEEPSRVSPWSSRLAVVVGLVAGTFGSYGSFGNGDGRVRADSRVLVLGLEVTPSSGSDSEPLTGADLAGLDRAMLTRLHAQEHMHALRDMARVASIRAEFRCTTLDDACLTRIAERRGVDRIVYGRAARLAPESDEAADSVRDRRENRESRVAVIVRVFDLYTRATRETVSGSIEARHLDSESHVEGLAEKLVSLLVRVPEEGAATIRAIAGSSVMLDERSMGTMPASGELVLSPLRVGRHALRVVRPNHTIWEAPIVVRTRESIRVTVDSGATLASLDEAAAHATATSSTSSTSSAGAPDARPLGSEGFIHPPPDYILSVPGGSGTSASSDVWHAGEGLTQVIFRIPLLEEHVASGEIRTTTHARVGFLPNVSSSGARVTAKLHF